MPAGGDESRRKMLRPQNTTKFVQARQRGEAETNFLVTRASDLMAAHDPRFWETLQDFSQNLAIWTLRRMLMEETGN